MVRQVIARAVLSGDREGTEPIGHVEMGDTFEAVEIASDFAWGTVRPAGTVGYIKLSALKNP